MTTIAPTSRVEGPSGRRLPGAIRKALRGVDRRLRVAGVMVGVGASLGMAAGVAVGVMGVDAVWPLPGLVRWIAWGVWVIGPGCVLLGALGRAALRRPGREALAAVAGRAGQGGAGARLSAAVALIEDGDRAHGSPELIEAVIARASEEAGGIDPGRAVPLERAWKRLLMGVLASAAVAGPAVLGIEPFDTLGARLVAPWNDPGTAGRLAIAVEPGDATIARGDALEVSATVRDRLGREVPGSARMAWTDASGDSHELEMGLAGDGTFAITLPRVDEAITYRIASGSGRSREFRVAVVEPVRVASHRWVITPPAYMGVAAEEWEGPAGLVAWEGSKVEIVAETDRPATRVTLDWPGEGGPIGFEPIDGSTRWKVEISAKESGEFVIIPEGEHGIVDRLGPSGRIEVRPDAPPVVAAGETEGAVRPDGELLVPVAARDDLAVAGAELHYSIDRVDGSAEGPNTGMVPVALDGLGTPEALGVVGFDLSGLELGHGDRVSVRIRVFDNRPGPEGPNEAWTGPRPVEVVEDVARFRAGEQEEALRPVREALEELARKAAEDRDTIEPLVVAADAERRDPTRWTERQQAELEALIESAKERVERLRELAEAIDADPELRALAEAIREAAEADAEAARSALDDAIDPEDRAEDLRRAEEGLEAASDQIGDLSEQLEDLAKTLAARPELADLARQEAELAERAEAMAGESADPEAPMPPIDPEALGELQAAQDQLARALNELMERAPGLGEAAQEAADEAEAASRELEQGSGEAARSAAEAMRRAAEQMSEASGSSDPSGRAEQLAQMLGEGESPSSPSDREPTGPPSGTAEAGVADPSAGLGLRSERAWGGLPGHLRTEMLRSSSGRYHPDYAPLIRLYFQEIARASAGSSASDEESP